MKKQYFSTLLLLAFVFTLSSSAYAEETTTGLDSSLNTRVVKPEIRVNTASTTLKAAYEAQKKALEAQRETMKKEFEVRKKAAEAKGDEMQAKREAKKIELEAKRAEMDAEREIKRAEAELRRASSTAKRVEFQQDIAKRKVEKTTKVILETIGHVEKIIVRLESRIAKVKTRGGDTTESERLVALAKTNLSDAKAVVATFASLDLSSDKAKENFEKIRTAAASARELIRTARENLMLAVRSLHAVQTKVEESNETTTETEQ